MPAAPRALPRASIYRSGRVKRALDLIQAGKAVTRGALQVVFHYTPYDELRRLGLNEKTEESARKAFPALTGMLVVNEVLPGGPADGTLQPGDVLVRVNGKLVSEFEPLEQVIDDSVGGTVDLELERGGKPVERQAQCRQPARHHAVRLPRVRRRGGAHRVLPDRRAISTSPSTASTWRTRATSSARPACRAAR